MENLEALTKNMSFKFCPTQVFILSQFPPGGPGQLGMQPQSALRGHGGWRAWDTSSQPPPRALRWQSSLPVWKIPGGPPPQWAEAEIWAAGWLGPLPGGKACPQREGWLGKPIKRADLPHPPVLVASRNHSRKCKKKKIRKFIFANSHFCQKK